MKEQSENTYMDLSLEEKSFDNTPDVPQEYSISSYSYSLGKERVDNNENLPQPTFSLIKIKTHSLPSLQLVRWIINPRKLYNGIINFRKKINTIPTEYLCFEKARCVGLSIHYRFESADEINVQLSIHAHTIMTNEIKIANGL